jgi:hypothetical protein
MDAVTRLRRVAGAPDRYGNPTYTESSAALPDARFAPKDVIPSPEPGREPVVTEPTLYWRNEWPDVVASDRLTVRGVTYEVQSIPSDWRGDTVGGLVVKLRDAEEGTP